MTADAPRVSDDLKEHTRSCEARSVTPPNDDYCTCALKERRWLRTEQEMHSAWRKRAEAAEARVRVLEKALSFYRDGFRLHAKRGPTGIDHSEWKPKRELLEDCGEKACAALSDTPKEEQRG